MLLHEQGGCGGGGGGGLGRGLLAYFPHACVPASAGAGPLGICLSIHWPIIRRLVSHPRQVCIVDDRRTYRRIDVLIGAMHVAAAIRGKCNSPTVGVMTPTSGAFPIAALAAWFLGKTLVPLNYLLKGEELQYVVDDCGTDTIVTSKLLMEHLPEPPKVKNTILLEDLNFTGV